MNPTALSQQKKESAKKEKERAKKAVDRFVRRFDESYRQLAYYAALPLVLTPELLNYLRNQFLQNVPWVAEVDLLLSDLCSPVGYELYAMDTAVRAYLLSEVKKELGPKRIQDVARLLIRYLQQLSRTNPFIGKHELQAQRWAAMVYLDAQQVHQEIKEALLSARSMMSWAEMDRLSRITKELDPQLRKYPELIQYAEEISLLLADPTRGKLDNIEVPPVPDQLEGHYQLILKAITRGQIIPFLGPDINLCDRQETINPSDWNPRGLYPPSQSELAVYLEKEIFGTSLTSVQCPLCDTKGELLPEGCPLREDKSCARLLFQQVSQLSELRFGKEYLRDALNQIATYRYTPNLLHRFLARLPRILRQKGYETPMLIVTANYDCTLELAFKEQEQPFDLVSYVVNKKCFLHQKFRKDDLGEKIASKDKKLIIEPNDYRDLDFDAYPVILKLYGFVDRADYQEKNFVITEDDFIDYLAQRPIRQMLPTNILAKLQRNYIWFLGYNISHWSQRVIMHRIWSGQTFRATRSWWAIQSNPGHLERELWLKHDVQTINISLDDYITNLARLLQELPVRM